MNSRTLTSLLLMMLLCFGLTACEVDDDDDFIFDGSNNNTADAEDDTSSPDEDMSEEDMPEDTGMDAEEDMVEDMPDAEGCQNTCPAPTPVCQETLAVSYDGPGSPDPEQDCRCDYTGVISVETCNFDEGTLCQEGTCVAIPSCGEDGPACPPTQETCVGNNLAIFAAACNADACELGDIIEQRSCDQCTQDSEFRATCVVEPEPELEPGMCRTDDDCPPSFCDGDIATTYPSKGLCTAEVCVYPDEVTTATDCTLTEQTCAVTDEIASCQ